MVDAAALARSYYRALDEHDYDALSDALAPEFVHDRPDMTLDGRERFVRFMREERPQKDTSHAVDEVYRIGESPQSGPQDGDSTEVAVRGRLLDAEGEPIVGFVDVFAVTGDRIDRIDTYTR